jgi:CHAT domain-containing protein
LKGAILLFIPVRILKVVIVSILIAVCLLSWSYAAEPAEGQTLQNGISALQNSRYAEASRLLGDYFDLAVKNGNHRKQMECLEWQFRLFMETVDYNKALACCRTALDLLQTQYRQEIDAKIVPEPVFLYRTRLANVYYSRKLPDKAWEIMDELEKVDRRKFDESTLVEFYITRGKMLRLREQYDPAIKNFEEAIKLSMDGEDLYSEVIAVCGLARVYVSKRDFGKAFELLGQIQEKANDSPGFYLQCFILESYAAAKEEEDRNTSLAYYYGALSLSKAIGNPGKTAEILLSISSVNADMGNWDKAMEIGREASSVAVLSGNTYQRVKIALVLLGIYTSSGRVINCEPLKNELLAAGKASPEQSDRVMSMYFVSRTLQYVEKNMEASEAMLKQTLEQAEKAGEKKMIVQSLVILGNLYSTTGRYEEAIDVSNRALALSKTIPEGVEFDDRYYFNNCSASAIMSNIGKVYFIQSDYSKAANVYKEALLLNTSPEMAYSRMNIWINLLAVTLLSYDFSEAGQIIIDSLKDFKNIENPVRRAIAYNLLITILSGFSRTKGLNQYDSLTLEDTGSPGAAIMEKIIGNPELVVIFNDAYKEWIKYSEERKDYYSLSIAYIFQGYLFMLTNRDAEAFGSINRGIEYAKKNNVAKLDVIGYIYLTELYVKQKNYPEAYRIKLLELESNKRQSDDEGIYRSLVYLGILSREMKQMEQAEDYMKQALKISEKQADSAIRGSALLAIGNLYYKEKKYSESIEYFKNALELYRNNGERRRTALCLYMLAMNYCQSGSSTDSSPYYQEAFDIFLSLGLIYELRDVAISYGSYLLKNGRDREALTIYLEAINTFVEWRDRLPAATNKDRLSNLRENRELFEGAVTLLIKLNRYEEALKYMGLSHSLELMGSFDIKSVKTGETEQQQLLEKVDDLKSRMTLLARQIEGERDQKKKESLSGILATTRQDFFKAMNEIRSKNPDLEQLLTVRGTELAAVQKILPADSVMAEYYPAVDNLFIFIVTSDSLKIRKASISRERLYEIVKSYRQAIIEKQDLSSEKNRLDRELLFSYLVETIRDDVKDKKNILVVPGGLLWYLPLESLGSKPGAYYLQEKNISYVSSSDISRMISDKGARAGAYKSLTAFGAPSGSELPFSRQEVETIGGIFPGSRIFIGDSATKANFLKQAPLSSILHIATHSGLDKKDINNSSIKFAGQNGLLRLGEIYGIHLPAASLVVLSSCESALGDDAPGAEFASLGSAFGAAGASSVIASLWKVEDASCAMLFEEFYKNMKSGKSRTESLRLAKLKLISNPKTSHPFYWGAFILLGDWR